MSTFEYQQTLPKKRMGSGALFFDGMGRLLLVEPSYKPTWEIPGGVVEAHESPKACAEREILEELGLEKKVGRLLCIDYNPTTDTRLESLMFIYDGGEISAADIQAIKLQENELLSFRFFEQDDLPENLSPTLRQRILTGWQTRLENGNFIYCENGLTS
ncbi:MAG: NUDIX hydrolase [Chloroflexota bacterium]